MKILSSLSDAEVNDGERLPLAVKEMGSCEIYPQNLAHNPNGRFVVVCGDGEYIIYTAMALRNKSFGAAQEFVWSADSSEYVIAYILLYYVLLFSCRKTYAISSRCNQVSPV